MDRDQRRGLVAVGAAVLAVALLFGAFVFVWLLPRGPEAGDAQVQQSNSSGATGAKIDAAPAANPNLAQVGAPSMAPVTDQPHITVQGTGRVSAKPDIVNLQVGVQIQNNSLDAAQSEAAAKMDAVMKQLKEAGVDDKDISTAQYNVEPVMNYRDNQPPVVTGFRVTNIVAVKLRDISKAGKLIDSIIGAGGNSIYGLSFGFSDPTAVMKQAREQAMNDAKAKADQLAALGGVALGAPLQIEELGANVPVPVMDAAAGAPGRAIAPSTPINPGQQEVAVQVNVVYGIK
jgi:uncharacterized protein YggE